MLAHNWWLIAVLIGNLAKCESIPRTFRMRSNDFYPEERPIHRVTVVGFQSPFDLTLFGAGKVTYKEKERY
ncbi:MAG TPA: hypothetical protein VK897_18700 [Anaerolineales bacterium]|nr:hypothetical protein [Anaerolineales bacterium]